MMRTTLLRQDLEKLRLPRQASLTIAEADLPTPYGNVTGPPILAAMIGIWRWISFPATRCVE